jgi:hypothetical protein
MLLCTPTVRIVSPLFRGLLLQCYVVMYTHCQELMKSVGNSYVHPLLGADEVGGSFLCTHPLSGADEVGG